MPLREFRIGPIGEELYPRWVAELAARLDDPALDRNVVVRDELARLYLGRSVDFERELGDSSAPGATRLLLASLDPRNATLEAEYYKELDLEKWKRVKPLLWFWQMFDHSPVGRNVRLGTQLRYMLAQRVFKKCGTGVRIFHGLAWPGSVFTDIDHALLCGRRLVLIESKSWLPGHYYCDASYSNLAEATVNYLAAVGIRMAIVPLERAAFFAQYREKKLRNVVQVGSGAFGNAATRIEAFVAAGGAYVYGSYPDIDGLFREQAAETDRRKREAVLQKAQQLMYEKAMFAPIWELGFLNGVGPRIEESGLGLITGHAYSAPYEDLALKTK